MVRSAGRPRGLVAISKAYTPDRGDVVRLEFSPQAGREQAGPRLALVLSPREYNEKVGLFICCPITSQVKGYAFEVDMARTPRVSGVALADHVSSLDWQRRNARPFSRAPNLVVENVVKMINDLIAT
ncbi:MAG TPA: type II toxin-antitoxin system PemK/MazF family toxin [Candidatus Eremiobacteraceae bacterium]|nr:type II toxin-antitoxin system PemK/MazF family toxin [Candidatus Eremiobacteraceae bacterium]